MTCPVSAAPDPAPPLLTLLRAASELSQLAAAAAARLRRRVARLVELPPLQHWSPLWIVCLELELRAGGKVRPPPAIGCTVGQGEGWAD